MRNRRAGKYGLAQRMRLSIAAAEAFISKRTWLTNTPVRRRLDLLASGDRGIVVSP